jgi:hypothetical protein
MVGSAVTQFEITAHEAEVSQGLGGLNTSEKLTISCSFWIDRCDVSIHMFLYGEVSSAYFSHAHT